MRINILHKGDDDDDDDNNNNNYVRTQIILLHALRLFLKQVQDRTKFCFDFFVCSLLVAGNKLLQNILGILRRGWGVGKELGGSSLFQ